MQHLWRVSRRSKAGSPESCSIFQCPQPSGLVELTNSHSIAFEEYGDPNGEPWLYFHEGGNSRLECAFFHSAAKARGLRLLAIDRPGIGGSSYYRTDSASTFARDALEFCDRLQLDRFSVLSHGSGGVFSLALAHLAPQRVTQQVSLGGLPGSVLGPDNLALRKATWWDGITPPLINALVQLKVNFSRQPLPEFIKPLLQPLNSADSRILNKPRVRQTLELDRREALRQGAQGIAQDIAMGFRKLEFSLAAVRVPLVIWQGRSDGPSAASATTATAYLIGRLPVARCHELPFRGYYFFLQDIDAVFARLSKLSAFSGRLAA